jgi:hypothetical protein
VRTEMDPRPKSLGMSIRRRRSKNRDSTIAPPRETRYSESTTSHWLTCARKPQSAEHRPRAPHPRTPPRDPPTAAQLEIAPLRGDLP